MKKIFSIVIAVCLVFGASLPCFADSFNEYLYTETYLVMDLTTGEILLASNEDVPMYPASLTKMMTALVCVDFIRGNNKDMSDKVTVDEDCLGLWDDYFNLKDGEQFTLEDAMNILLVRSVNGIAEALAKYVAGTEEEFAKLMNKKAEALGCTNTHFVTPHGLDNDEHFSSARDLAIIAKTLMDDEYLAGIVAQESYSYSATNFRGAGTVETTNALINGPTKMYVGNTLTTTKYENGKVIGVKTGTEDKAGYCLIGAAEKDGTKMMAVVLKSSGTIERYADVHNLLNWAFANFKTVKLAAEGDDLGEVKVKKGEFNHVTAVVSKDIYVTMPKEAAESSLKIEASLDEQARAPLSQGAVLGRVTVLEGGTEVGSLSAVAKEDIKEGGFLSNFGIEDAKAAKIFKALKIIFIILLVLFAALMAVRTYNKAQARKRKAAKARAKAAREAREREQFRQQYDEDHGRQ